MEWDQAEPHHPLSTAGGFQDAEDPTQEEEFWRRGLRLRPRLPPPLQL